jgi:hypothetical protein
MLQILTDATKKQSDLCGCCLENILRFIDSAPDLEGSALWKMVYVRIGRSKREIARDRHCPRDLLEVPVTLIPGSNK